LVNAELVLAIRTESAVALRYWFRVTVGVVWKWRQTIGVGGRATTPGSRKAIHAAALKGAEAVKVKEWTDEECDAKSEMAKRKKPWKYFGPRWTLVSGEWIAEQRAHLGTDDDEVIAVRIGRTAEAVRCERTRAKIPKFRDRRRKG
jgi:hypothetical protein